MALTGRMKNGISNEKFAEEDKHFKDSVKRAQERGEKVAVTKRQASKFRNKRGIAYRYGKAIPKIKKTGEE